MTDTVGRVEVTENDEPLAALYTGRWSAVAYDTDGAMVAYARSNRSEAAAGGGARRQARRELRRRAAARGEAT